MTNVLERAIACNDADDAAEMIRNALGIESDDVECGTRSASVRAPTGNCRKRQAGRGRVQQPRPR
jgi:hypothetical protein